jgi:hypothetical protein
VPSVFQTPWEGIRPKPVAAQHHTAPVTASPCAQNFLFAFLIRFIFSYNDPAENRKKFWLDGLNLPHGRPEKKRTIKPARCKFNILRRICNLIPELKVQQMARTV